MRTATVVTRFVVTLQHFLELLKDYQKVSNKYLVFWYRFKPNTSPI